MDPQAGNIFFLIPGRIADNRVGGPAAALSGRQNEIKSFGEFKRGFIQVYNFREKLFQMNADFPVLIADPFPACLLYTSDAADD